MSLEQRLRQRAEISGAKGNPRTGTVLVHFFPEIALEQIRVVVADEMRRVGAGPVPTVATANGARAARAGPTGVSEPPAPIALRKTDGEWHRKSAEVVCRTLATHASEGLTQHAAAQRLVDHGPNALPSAPRRSDLQLFMAQLTNGPVAMLGAAAVLSIATGGLVDALAIGAVVMINATIGYVTERQSERIIEGLNRPKPGRSRVVRNGVERESPIEALVPGDLIRLGAGERVPADIRVLKADQLAVNESLLTGESTPVGKRAGQLRGVTTISDRTNMLYRDTHVLSGAATGVVVATGAATEVGLIHQLIGESRPPETPMQRQLDRIGTQLVWLSGAICAAIFVLGWARGYGFLGMLNRAVSLAVAALPEGLPTVATTTLALGVRQMRSRRALVRSLKAVETLGACDIICLDKTGTLTENRLRAVEVYFADGRYLLDDTAAPAPPQQTNAFLMLGRTLALCVENGHGRQFPEPDSLVSPTEAALLDVARHSGIDPQEFRRLHSLVEVEHRAEDRPYLITHHEIGDTGVLASAKGSPEHVLPLCESVLDGDGVRPLDATTREKILRQNRRMAAKALRVLAVASSIDPVRSGSTVKLTWLGLVGLADPLRDGTDRVIMRLHRAGIQTVMLTGDQAGTARAIARRLNLSAGGELNVVDARDLSVHRPEIERVHAFSRVAPSQKSEIVQAFQDAGHVVAMTGDGVNDGPALKAADIGVALGANGAETARLAADVVLEDDNLETLLFAAQQGRTIYGNIRKSIHYLLSTNLSEIEVMLASVLLGVGQPLSPMQLLWINLITDTFPSLALAMEPPEPDAMDVPPRDPNTPIIGGEDFRRLGFESSMMSAGALASYFYALRRYGPGASAGGYCFLTLVLSQLLHAWNCRSDRSLFERTERPRNQYLNIAIGGSIALNVLSIVAPPLRRLLGIPTIGLVDLLVIFAGAAGPTLVNALNKGGRLRSADRF